MNKCKRELEKYEKYIQVLEVELKLFRELYRQSVEQFEIRCIEVKGKTGLAKIIAHLTNSSPFKKRFFNRPIRFPGSNFDFGEINGNVIGSARSKDLTA